jgi:hypothetical protein
MQWIASKYERLRKAADTFLTLIVQKQSDYTKGIEVYTA